MAVIPTSFAVPLEIAVAAVPDDDRVWVPQAPHVWFRPLMFNTVTGQWCNPLKVTAAGIVSRHRHPGVVFGYVRQPATSSSKDAVSSPPDGRRR
ncbi:cupin domain-containing protein [Streptomyces sp. NPDC000994]